MAESQTISKSLPEKESMNYAVLREAGIAYLENLNSRLWTDFNHHDPGITTLEQLAYAITDLGYRTNYAMKDLLATDPSVEDSEEELKSFFTAREILTCNPVTVDDYRKVIIDVPGVANAWVEASSEQEQAIYADFTAAELTYTEPAASHNYSSVALLGLYQVLLEFDEHSAYGDLNDQQVETELAIDSGDLDGLVVEIELEFPAWDDESIDWADAAAVHAAATITKMKVSQTVAGYSIDFDLGEGPEFEVQVFDTVSSLDPVEVPALSSELKDLIDEVIYSADVSVETLVSFYVDRIEAAQAVVAEVKQVLHATRNLCEDYFAFKSLRIEEIGMCADIELETDADVDEVAAAIYYEIDRFLAPVMRFYTLGEMLELTWTDENGVEQPYTSDEIFEGPRLNNGFMLQADLDAAVRQKAIHVSDLINIIMDIDGVVAVKSIQIANYPQGDPSIPQSSQKWCLHLAYDKGYVPRLSIDHSKLLFFKEDIPYRANVEEVEELIDALQAQEPDPKPLEALQAEAFEAGEEVPESLADQDLDHPVPEGSWRDLESYQSVQEQFPLTYGIGFEGLPSSSSDQRRAQANQFKGFLLFFDQLLANYLSQLAHLKELFSMNSSVDRTYFNQPLYDIPDVGRLLKDFMETNGFDANSAVEHPSSWRTALQTFEADDENAYRTALNTLSEEPASFLERRSTFLNHLMARFAEQFTDYTLVMYGLTGSKESEELNDDKLGLLQNYPEISRDRGKAFDYKDAEEIWETDNVSGFVKRLGRLIGIEDTSRRNLYCPPEPWNWSIMDNGGSYTVQLHSDDGELVYESASLVSFGEATTEMETLQAAVESAEWYETIETAGMFVLNFYDGADAVVLASVLFSDGDQLSAIGDELWLKLFPDCDAEGFHLVEHILLRPKFNDAEAVDDFFPVSFDSDCYCTGTEDAWSFRASLILPYWPERFQNMDYRAYVQRIARQECPAHIALKICWIDQEQMAAFETAWHAWLTENAQEQPDKTTLSERLNNLIEILFSLRNVYPATTLHDCSDDDDGSSPAVLGSARLGTF